MLRYEPDEHYYIAAKKLCLKCYDKIEDNFLKSICNNFIENTEDLEEERTIEEHPDSKNHVKDEL